MEIKDIKNWFEVAIPEPTIEQACIQIGCHYEEVSEMQGVLLDCGDTAENLAEDYKSLNCLYLDHISMIGDRDKIALLDALCDQIVTAVGVAHMLDMDIEGALKEVNESNHSKFEDGKAVFDENGKITKGANYRRPNLERFI